MKNTVRVVKEISNCLKLSELLYEIERFKEEFNILEEEDFEIEADIDYRDRPTHIIIFNRWETDEEFSARREKEREESEKRTQQLQRLKEQKEIAAQLTELAEHQQYLKLKAKYEKS